MISRDKTTLIASFENSVAPAKQSVLQTGDGGTLNAPALSDEPTMRYRVLSGEAS